MFNAAQVDGYDAPAAPALHVLPDGERIEAAERFFASLGANVKQGGSRAYYQPATDTIQMPPFGVFRDAIAYYATLGHEATHWTGADKRLGRDLNTHFGSLAYAGEELVAELGAAFLCADLRLRNAPRPDHAEYLATWLKALRADPRALFTAASKAQQAVDYLHDLQPLAPEPGREAASTLLSRPAPVGSALPMPQP